MCAAHTFRFESFGLRLWRGAPARMARRHSHTEIELNLVLRGNLGYRFAGSSVTFRPGRLHVFCGLTPHQLEESAPGSEAYFLTLPLADFCRWRLPENITAPLLRGEILTDADGANDPRRFARWLEDLHGGDPRRIRVTLPEVHARFERMALSTELVSAWSRETKARSRELHSGTLARIELMLHVIAARFAEPLSLHQLTAETGWHPHYAAGQFRRWIGTPPGEYLLRQRVAHAQHLLTSTDDKVISIAEACGFGTQSSFYTAFARIAGCTPGAHRRRVG